MTHHKSKVTIPVLDHRLDSPLPTRSSIWSIGTPTFTHTLHPMSPDELGLVAKHVMKLLVERRYDELEEVTGGTRLSADAIADAVDDVGAPLVMPPPATWNALHVVAVRN